MTSLRFIHLNTLGLRIYEPQIKNDDLRPYFLDATCFICNYPSEHLLSKLSISKDSDIGMTRKAALISKMQSHPLIISVTRIGKMPIRSKTFSSESIIHIGSFFSGRMKDLHNVVQVIFHLILNRHSYTQVLAYNFSFDTAAPGIFAKYFLGKRLLVSLEDDYTVLPASTINRIFFSLVKSLPDIIILNNQSCARHFKAFQLLLQFNCTYDLSYLADRFIETSSRVKLLFSGSLDHTRGAHLIPSLIVQLRSVLSEFDFIVTGTGPLEKQLSNSLHTCPELVMLGFLPQSQYERLVQEVDYCLVLQDPEAKESEAVFPSKVNIYSKYRKTILEVAPLPYAQA